MKKLFTILALLISCGAFAQQPTIQKVGAPSVLTRNLGAGSWDSAVYLPNRDTTFTPSMPSAIIVRQADGLAYLWTGGPWKLLGSPVWGKIIPPPGGSLVNQVDLYDSLQARQRTLVNGYGWVIVGGAGTFDSAHVRKVDSMYRVNDSTVGYTINGIPYTALLRGTAAGGISSLVLTVPTGLFTSPVAFTNTGGAWTGILPLALQNPGTFFAGPSVGASATPSFRQISLSDIPSGIPNATLANSTLGLTIDQVGAVPAFSAISVALGNNIVLHLPWASATTSGPLTATDWNRFNANSGGVVTAVNGQIGNVVVYNADSLGGYPIDFTNFHNGWVIAADTVTHTIVFQAPGSGSGIVSLNGLNATTQSFAIGNSGTSPGWSSVTATHTLNVPYVNGADSGLVTPTLFNAWNAKQPAGNYITALTGQVTAAGPGSATATIAANTVTNSNLALMSAGTVKANLTGSSANPTDVTIATLAASIGTHIGNTPTGGFPLWNINLTSVRELFAGTNTTIDSTTNPGGYTINSTGSGGVAQIFAKAPLFILGTDTVRADTTLGHLGALSTIPKLYQTIDSLGGVSYIQFPRQGLSPLGTHGDSLGLGGIIGAFYQADTIYTGGFPWLWLNLPFRATPLTTDSLALIALNGQVFKTVFPTGTVVTPTNNGLMSPAMLARLDSTVIWSNSSAYPFLDSMVFSSLHHDSATLKRFQLAASSLLVITDSGNLYKNAYGIGLANQTAGTLMGYDGSTGVAEVITLGTGLSMSGNTLNSSGGSGGFANPMTAQYDLIIGGSGGAPTRLATGTSNWVLHAGSEQWAPVSLTSDVSGTLAWTSIGLPSVSAHTFLGASSATTASFLQPAFTDLSGNIGVSQMNSGTGASGTTFWAGDGTWKTPSGSGGDAITSPNSSLSVGGSSSATTLDLNLAHSNAFTATQGVSISSVGTAFSDAIELYNTTAATASVPQDGPSQHVQSQGWSTGSGISMPADWWIRQEVASGSVVPANSLVFYGSQNGGTKTATLSLIQGQSINVIGSVNATVNYTAGPTGGYTFGLAGTAGGIWSDSAYEVSIKQGTHASAFRIMNTYTAAGNQGFYEESWQRVTNTMTLGAYSYGAAPAATVNLVGTWTGTTQTTGDNTTKLATDAFVIANSSTGNNFSPTVTNLSNTGSFAADRATYTQDGPIVTGLVSGSLQPTASSTVSSFTISLPVGSALAAPANIGAAVLVFSNSNIQSGYVQFSNSGGAQTTMTVFFFAPASTAGATTIFTCHFQYHI